METIKINFTDFWEGFIKTDNYFYNLLSKHYNVVIADDPEILFYSCYRNEHLNFKCIKIYYSAETVQSDYFICDFAMTMDFSNRKNHFRLPLYALYIEQQNKMHELLQAKHKDEIMKLWGKKNKFCCMVVSNSYSKKRIDFFHSLSKLKRVDSGGKYLNNVGGPVPNKLEFIKDYKFVMAFENESRVGYTTEKILEPLFVNSIPIYWGNPKINLDFNKKRFINYNDFKNEDELFKYLLELEKDPEKAAEILCQPVFPGGQIPSYINEDAVYSFLKNIIDRRFTLHPISKSIPKSVVIAKNKYKNFEKRVLKLLNPRN